MKEYILIELLTKCGEYEFSTWTKREFNSNELSADDVADSVARNFYEGEVDGGDFGYYHNGGEVHTSVASVKQLTKDEYDLLTRLLS